MNRQHAYLTRIERFTAACMLYFAGAIACEERYQQGEVPSHLWNTDDPAFTNFVTRACGLEITRRITKT